MPYLAQIMMLTLLLPWSIMGTQMIEGISLQRQVIANPTDA